MKKLIPFILLFTMTGTTMAQRISDSTLLNMSDQDLGLHFLQKSRNQKEAAYILLGVGAGSAILFPFVFYHELDKTWEGTGDYTASAALLLSTAACTTGSLILLGSAAKSKGKADMLLRKKNANETPGYDLDLGLAYRRKAQQQRRTGWLLLGTGLTMTFVVPSIINKNNPEGSSASTVVSTVGLGLSCASFPFFINAAGNRARASILLKSENIPFSYLQGSSKMHSIGIGIPLGN